MKKQNWFYLLTIICISLYSCKDKEETIAEKIDRKAVVTRHNVKITEVDTLGSLNVGNGEFAFTVDVTGLQSFPEYYQNGVPLGTQSEWGWHSFPNKENYEFSETLKGYNFNGKADALYAIQNREDERKNDAADYFRANPHRLQLGNVGLEILKSDGTLASPEDLKDINQELNLWTGKIESQFTVEGVPVKVTTYGDSEKDAIAAKIESPLVTEGRIKMKLRFPYPTNQFADRGTNYEHNDLHETKVNQENGNSFVFNRTLDNDAYAVQASLDVEGHVTEVAPHYFTIQPKAENSFEVAVEFASEFPKEILNFSESETHSIAAWEQFWESGGAVDFSECTDPRAFEIERRVVLSQYLTRSQCAGHYPVQETGLTYNSWFGKPHMEMYWWHSAHYPLWGRTELLEKSIGWYFDAYDKAKLIAERQGYKGVRWQKMTDHYADEAPSNVGSFLIWQQPHVIYLSEMIYRNNPTKANLEKYKKLIFSTADFMASYPNYDEANDRYILGKGVIPAQECFNKIETYNPPFELAYWKWALENAQQWRERLGMEREQEWQKVIDRLSPLAQHDGVYLAAESVPNSYSPTSEHTIDHPAVLGALGFVPSTGFVDVSIMNKTFNIVDNVWHWDHTWGWDFPLEAMTATRLQRPEEAIKALLRDEITNTYLPGGHNYQTPRLTLYLPGNGGILSAVALMCAGYDGNTTENPGFPKDGKWNVKWEGLQPMP
ncbi:hypothetical protein RBH94_03735 [Aestuariibaculum sp. YM273]|uniref:hypothetical protein n=1 Tax=Aestuariibaculum sp. YM273 TaxID=3070659 RepID=UPI0027DC5E23|nr:hypothetical protein [Aestuariibaculum sp. YM273]WMI66278.1 hypothetical protein RBH94_03735 [Aestuariibaculum sp. YM273]